MAKKIKNVIWILAVLAVAVFLFKGPPLNEPLTFYSINYESGKISNTPLDLGNPLDIKSRENFVGTGTCHWLWRWEYDCKDSKQYDFNTGQCSNSIINRYGLTCPVGDFIELLSCTSKGSGCEPVFREKYRKESDSDLLDIRVACDGGNCYNQDWFKNKINGKYVAYNCYDSCDVTTEYTCDDPTGDDPYIKGEVKILKNGVSYGINGFDECNGNELTEATCSSVATATGNIDSKNYLCSNGCSDGKCIKSPSGPTNECDGESEGAKACLGKDVEVCTLSNNVLRWETTTTCPGICSGGGCQGGSGGGGGGGGSGGGTLPIVETLSIDLGGLTEIKDPTINYKVNVKNRLSEPKTVFIEGAIYCGQGKSVSGVDPSRYGLFGRQAAIITDQDLPCVASESSFVQRKEIKVTDNEITPIAFTNIKIPTSGDMVRGNIPNYPTEEDPKCIIKAHVFDKCWVEGGTPGVDSISTSYLSNYQVINFNKKTGELLDQTCCKTEGVDSTKIVNNVNTFLTFWKPFHWVITKVQDLLNLPTTDLPGNIKFNKKVIITPGYSIVESVDSCKAVGGTVYDITTCNAQGISQNDATTVKVTVTDLPNETCVGGKRSLLSGDFDTSETTEDEAEAIFSQVSCSTDTDCCSNRCRPINNPFSKDTDSRGFLGLPVVVGWVAEAGIFTGIYYVGQEILDHLSSKNIKNACFPKDIVIKPIDEIDTEKQGIVDGLTFQDLKDKTWDDVAEYSCTTNKQCKTGATCRSLKYLGENDILTGAEIEDYKDDIASYRDDIASVDGYSDALKYITGGISGAAGGVAGGTAGYLACNKMSKFFKANKKATLPILLACTGIGAVTGATGGGYLGYKAGEYVNAIDRKDYNKLGFCILEEEKPGLLEDITRSINKALGTDFSTSTVAISMVALAGIVIFLLTRPKRPQYFPIPRGAI